MCISAIIIISYIQSLNVFSSNVLIFNPKNRDNRYQGDRCLLQMYSKGCDLNVQVVHKLYAMIAKEQLKCIYIYIFLSMLVLLC